MQLGSLPLAGLGLAVVLGLIVLAGRLARMTGLSARLGGSIRPGGRLAALETLALDGRRRVLLLRCDDRAFLVLTGGPQDVFLGWVPPPAPGA